MGALYSSAVMLGYKLCEGINKKTVKARSCSHKVPRGAEFCPKCGKPIWCTQDLAIIDWENVDNAGFDCHIDGYDCEESDMYIGKYLSRIGQECGTSLVIEPIGPEIEDLKNEIATMLSNYDIDFVKTNFGQWHIADIS